MEDRDRKERLTPIVLILVFSFMAAGIVTTGYFYYRNYEKRYRVEVEEQLSVIGNLTAGELVLWRKERLGDGLVLSRNPVFRALVKRYFEHPDVPETRELLQSWLGQVQTRYGYCRVFLLDSQGRERLSVPDNHDPVPSHLLRKLPKLLQLGEVNFLDFYREAENQPIHLSVAAPIPDEQKENTAIGLVVLDIDPEQYLYPFIGRWPTRSRTGETLLVRKEGNDVLVLNQLKFRKNSALNLRIPMKNQDVSSVKAALGEEGIVECKDYRGVPVIADLHPVPDSPWFLDSRLDMEEVYAPLRERLWLVILLIGAMVLCAGACVGFVWRRQTIRFYRERYESGQALRDSEEKLRAVIYGSPVPKFVIDSDHRIIFWNKGMEELSGIEAGETIGTRQSWKAFYDEERPCLADLLVDSDLEGVHEWYGAKCSKSKLVSGAYEVTDFFPMLGNEGKWLHLTAAAIRDLEGNTLGAVETIEDITDRKVAEEALKKTAEELELEVQARTVELKTINEQLFREVAERKRAQDIVWARFRLMEYSVSHSLNELLQATLDEVEALTGSLIGFFHFVEADQKTLCLQAWSTRTLLEMCTAKGKGLHYSVDEAGVWVDCVYQRRPVIHNDYSALPHRKGMPAGHAEVVRELVVPVFRGDSILAILGVGNKPVDYDVSDIETVSLIADLAWDITERKRAEEILRLSEAKFLDLYENAPCAYFSVGTDATITLCNRLAGELLGCSREELIGKPVFELYADGPEGKEQAGKVFERFLAGESIADEELQMQKADGAHIWISLTVNGVRDSEGQLIESRSMVLDISDRKEAEEALRKSEERYRTLFEDSRDGICSVRRDGEITDANPSFLEIFGYTREEMIGMNVRDLYVDPTDRTKFLQEIGEKGFVKDYEIRFRNRYGTVVDCRITSSVYFGEDGSLAGYRGIVRDVTHQKRAAEALMESEERFRTVFEQGPLGMSILWPNLQRIAINARLTEMLGYTEEELLKLTFLDFTHPDDLELTRVYIDKLLKKEIPFYQIEKRYIKKGGEIIWVRVTLSAVRDSQGELLYLVSMIEDINERKRVEDELSRYRTHLEDLVAERTQELQEKTRALETANIRLQDADRHKSIFLASMSHELRTPLNAIIGFTGIMLMGMAGELTEEQKKQLTMVKNSAKHLLSLVEEVLDIARIEVGGVTLSLEHFELGEVVDSVIQTVAPVAEKKGLEIVRQVPSHLALTSDKRRVMQIFMNLIGNAVKFTERGQVKISAAVLGDGSLEIRVTDTGIGIKKEDMKRLFSPFQQTDETLTKAYEGTGLGLYLCKKLVSVLGGDITASSTYGRGSEFTVVLPLVYGGSSEKDSGS